MSSNDIFVLLVVSLLLVLLPAPGLYKMFQKAGIPAWKAFVPFYNTWEIVKAAHLRKHWFFWQFIPVAGWFITMWFFVEWVKLFGKFKLYQHAAAALVPFLYFPYIGYNKKDKYLGVEVVKKHKKTAAREWIDAAVFAIVAATLIRTFVFEAYVIPTGSMEKTLLVNDFLFVSKLSYGPRIPNTPLAIPFVHHTAPITNSKSYSEIIRLPYTRWFASPVKRNDVVVFNFPAGDTVINRDEYQSAVPYYDVMLNLGRGDENAGRAMILDNPDEYPLVVRPVDKKENYIKRCVAIAGDTIHIKEGDLYVNNEKAYISPTAATDYIVTTNNKILSEEELKDAGVRISNSGSDFRATPGYNYVVNLTLSEVELVKKIPGVTEVKKYIDSGEELRIFPRNRSMFQWGVDSFGPLWIPKKGVSIQLTPQNVTLYKRAINVYEKNKWEESGGKIFINGKEATAYTFKMNYYWMMGDNRHQSQDSRFWGFVPEDHVVGEAWTIWMSWEGGVRWNRLFRSIK